MIKLFCSIAAGFLVMAAHPALGAPQKSADRPVVSTDAQGRKVAKIVLSSDPLTRAGQLRAAKNWVRQKRGGASSPSDGASTMNLGDCDSYQYCDSIPPEVDLIAVEAGWTFWDSESGQQRETLEQVVVQGNRSHPDEPICSVTISGPYGTGSASCFDLPELWAEPAVQEISARAPVIGELVDLVMDMVEVVIPLLPQCVVTTINNPIRTPDQDESSDWLIARDALLLTYGGDLGAIRLGVTFDVRYPNGNVVRLIVDGRSNAAGGIVPLGRHLFDGIPRTPSPCSQ